MLHVPRPIILASRSPRRIALLRQIGLNFEVVPSGIDDRPAASLSPPEATRALSAEKARQVASPITDGLVIGADTLVALDGDLLGKPLDEESATSMLERLSGRTHEVITSFCIRDCPEGGEVIETETTKVSFRTISHEEIHDYVSRSKPFGYAGAYAIQNEGAIFVQRIEGCYFNIVGFPLTRFYLTITNPDVRRRFRIDG